MKPIIFFGSSPYSIIVLEELKQSNLLPKIIVTTPDQPTGRGLKLQENPVKIYANHNSITCLTSVKELLVQNLADYIGLVAAYGRIIGPITLSKFNNQIYCIHPSLLPKYRGPSPLQSQVLEQEIQTGATLFQIDTDIDHGPIVSQTPLTLLPQDTTKSLGTKLFIAGTHLFIDFLSNQQVTLIAQNHTNATLTHKISRNDGKIDYTILQNIISKKSIPNSLRTKFQAYSPWPGIWSTAPNGKRIKLIKLDPITIQEEGGNPKKI